MDDEYYYPSNDYSYPDFLKGLLSSATTAFGAATTADAERAKAKALTAQAGATSTLVRVAIVGVVLLVIGFVAVSFFRK